ncbi:MAG: hypothetical protein VB118_04775 [Oscillospiraceae bacterium]|nr:hypothetical protein [Oscillospiraceae bacterium]
MKKSDLIERVYAFNRSKASEKAANEKKISDKDAEIASLKSAKAAIESELTGATDRMREIANMFSASMWKLLPQSIKSYFELYRK